MVFLLIIFTGLNAQNSKNQKLLALQGNYIVFGIAHTTGEPYSGKVTIRKRNSKSLSITRFINGKKITGWGKIMRTPPSEIDEFLISFNDKGKKYKAVYLMQADHDAYMRLTGYIYTKDSHEKGRGLETLFPEQP